jgi:small subunit ribosomal protein S6
MSSSTLRNYEAMVILNAQCSEQEINDLVEKLAGILTKGGAVIKETARWGHRKLAYPINKKNDGYYVIYYFTMDDNFDALEPFERACRYDENIMRNLVVKVPLKKRGEDVVQIVPAPGFMADFKFSPRNARRRPTGERGFGGRGAAAGDVVVADAPAEAAVAVEAVEAAGSETAAPAAEPAVEEQNPAAE